MIMHDKKYIYRDKHKQVMQCYTSKETSYIHLLQYHVVLLERAVCGTLMQDSALVPPLTARALDPTCVWQLWHPTNAVYWDFIH